MHYVGGKTRLASKIANSIHPRGMWWEPFCGGLSVTTKLASIHPHGLVSDSCSSLINLYLSVRRGWIPPNTITREDYAQARSLPDTNPLKAFCGFGCSFRGKWFAGYSGNRTIFSAHHPNGMNQYPAQAASRGLLRDIPILSSCEIFCASFFEFDPGSLDIECMYLDPPYEGTIGYGANLDIQFDHDKFWNYAEKWSQFCRVFVSELRCPIKHNLIWTRPYEKRLGSGSGQINNVKNEKLFQII